MRTQIYIQQIEKAHANTDEARRFQAQALSARLKDLGIDEAQAKKIKKGFVISADSENAKFEDNLMAGEWELRDVFIAFEKAFDIKIPADDVQRLKTVGEAFEYIEQKLLAKDNKKNVPE